MSPPVPVLVVVVVVVVVLVVVVDVDVGELPVLVAWVTVEPVVVLSAPPSPALPPSCS